ncbi:hypothetical protein [Candidatus Sodalis endolongispinus]|uniref:hypothetical protein n=1 Tax=Candidatus Sodalis endolongispinus TaxID=2812662 RepID=UPI0035E44F30
MQRLTPTIAVVTLGLVISGCATREHPAAPASSAQARLTDQTVMAVNWVQQSGEISALAYQAFSLIARKRRSWSPGPVLG